MSSRSRFSSTVSEVSSTDSTSYPSTLRIRRNADTMPPSRKQGHAQALRQCGAGELAAASVQRCQDGPDTLLGKSRPGRLFALRREQVCFEKPIDPRLRRTGRLRVRQREEIAGLARTGQGGRRLQRRPFGFGRQHGFNPPLPPRWGFRGHFAPTGKMPGCLGGGEDAERKHDLLKRCAAVIAVLLHPEADALAPRRQQATVLGDDSRSLEQNLVFRGHAGRGAPALSTLDVAELRFAFEHMTMVAREHDHAPAGAADVEQLLDGADVPRGPGDTNLIALGEVVVDRVDHDPHDTAVGVGDRLGHCGRDPRRVGFAQVSLVKQYRRRPRRARRAQPRVPGEPFFFRRRLPGRDLAAQQARTRRLGHRGQGCNHHGALRSLVRHQLDPCVPHQIAFQFTEYRHAHRVDDQDQHRMLPSERHDPAVEHRLDAQQAAVVRSRARPACQELAEFPVLLLPRRVGLPRQDWRTPRQAAATSRRPTGACAPSPRSLP